METKVEEILKAKGINVTAEEASVLQSQWEGVQSLKGVDDEFGPDDIALTHDPRRGEKSE
ncbi:hypothetical protein [Bacillus sp. FJAT-44742]|uniref:hypothetical protein n=1 Tax=Bacillus sp. FJAT-44742 TaxID=2014005 RepID=UPI000C244616|nr:hypothetical protein [Bacillus sp. FJAT-44742]